MAEEEAGEHERRMTLFEHLAELRGRLIKSLVAVAIGMVVAWFLYPQILDFLIDPYCDVVASNGVDLTVGGQPVDDCALYPRDPLEGFALRMKIAAFGGIALAMPVLLWQLWRFVAPGLYPNERRYAVPFVVSALLLFVLGAGLAYWTMPRALGFLEGVGGDQLVGLYSPAPYVTLVTYMMLAFGLGFEFPILLVFLQMAGLLTAATLRGWRRYAIVVIVVLVAVVTPSGDPFSLLALSIPMWLFYEAAIVFGRLRERRTARQVTQPAT